MSTKQDGDWGEALVEKYLSERGCRIVEREWRCRFGEIDLIAEKDGVLLFVEVKLRTNLQYGAPREYVTVKKQEKLRAAALLYLSGRELDVPPASTWRRSTPMCTAARAKRASATSQTHFDLTLEGRHAMALYAIGDLHLSLGTNKPMDVFGPKWANYVERIRENFSKLNDDDVIVIAGDISWGMSLEQSLPDFQFIDALPGRKILLKGNHDYWWGTASKMKKFFAEHDITTLDILYNNAFFYSDHAICGTRGWFYEEDAAGTHTGKMLAREALRLEASLKAAEGKPIYCFLHYPPIYQGYKCPEMLELLDKYEVERCYYGHLHGYTHRRAFEGMREKTEYALIAADYVAFQPVKICN